jgi:hypothetical protein
MTAPDHTLAPFKNHLHQWGHPYMHKSPEGIHVVNPALYMSVMNSWTPRTYKSNNWSDK